MSPLKVIYVAAAVLKNVQGQIFLVQRPINKQMAGLWEFPGGKIEKEELPEQTLQRELKEELGIAVTLHDLTPFCFVSHSYPDFHLVMLVYLCHHWQGDIMLCENQQAFSWACPDDLKNYPMPPADLPIVDLLCN